MPLVVCCTSTVWRQNVQLELNRQNRRDRYFKLPHLQAADTTASVGSSKVIVCPSGKTTTVFSAWRVTVRPLYFTVTGHGNGFFPHSFTRFSDCISDTQYIQEQPKGSQTLDRVPFTESCSCFAVVCTEESMLFLKILDYSSHQPCSELCGILPPSVGKQPLTNESIPGKWTAWQVESIAGSGPFFPAESVGETQVGMPKGLPNRSAANNVW